jgi:hypothetical protein
VLLTKVSAVAILRNAITVISTALPPIAVVGVPVLGAVLLPRALLGALLFLIAVLLCVLMLTVLVLPLLLLRVLLLVIPVLPLWLLHALLLLFRFASLVLTLLMLVILSFALLLVLRISRSRDSETQGKNGGASNSKYFRKLRFQATLRNSALELDFVVRTSAGFLMVKKCKMKNYGAELDLIS